MNDKIYDVVIIGGGPGGYSAALYCARSGMSVLVLEKLSPGGQMATTGQVDNYPGFEDGIDGFELGEKMKKGADRFGAETAFDEVIRVDLKAEPKKITTTGGELLTKTVVIATGASPRELGLPEEKKLRGARTLQTQLFSLDNVEVLWDTVVEKINGADQVESITIRNVKTEASGELPVDGVFIAVGIHPQSGAFDGLVEMDHGYIKAGEDCETSVPGIFAAGDVRTKQLRQVSTAVADGANAITSVERYLTVNS